MRLRAASAAVLLLGVIFGCGDDEPSEQATAGKGSGADAGDGGKSGSTDGGKPGSSEAGATVGPPGGAPHGEAGGGGEVNGQAGLDSGEGGHLGFGGEGGQAGAVGAETVTVDVTPQAGGNVTLGDTLISVPPGAVSEAVSITLAVVDPSAVAGLPAENYRVGRVFALTPHGLSFSVPVSITLGHSGGSGGELAVLRLDDEADQTWATVADTTFTANNVTFATSTFSIVVPIELAVPGDVIALQQFGTNSTDSTAGVVFDHQDSLIVVSRSPGETPGTDFDAFIRKLVPDTQLGWKESWKNAVSSTDNPNLGQADSVNAVCIDDDDNVIAVGDTNGVLAGPNNSGALDGWARKLSPAGDVLWTRQIFGGTNTRNDTANGVAADSDGNVLITGSLDFLGNNVGDAYVRKLDPAGEQLWEYEFTPGGTTYDRGVAIAVASPGDPVVLGWTAGDVGGPNAGEDDFFVSKLDADTGAPLWTVQYGTGADDCAWAITVDPSGDVLVAGQTGTCLDSAYPSLDSFVMKLDGDNGSTVWKHDVATPTGEERARAVAVDPLGNVLVAGHSTGSFDTGKNVNVGKLDVYVRKLSPAGTPLWTNLFGNAEDQRGYGVAASSSGLVAVVGATQGGLDDQTSAGGWDAFIAWLKP